MKRTIIALCTLTVMVIACTPKASPSGSSAAASMPADSSISMTQADIDAGKVIFTTKCTKCHAAKDKYVADHTYSEATGVLNKMSGKAKLSQEEANQLAAYVNSVAKK